MGKTYKNPLLRHDMTGTLLQQAIAPARLKTDSTEQTVSDGNSGEDKGTSKGRMPRYELVPGEKERGLIVEWPESLINAVKKEAYSQHKSVKVWLGKLVMKKLRFQYKTNK